MHGGLEADALRRKIEPPGHTVAVPAGLNPCDVPADVLKDYLLGTKPVDFSVLRKTARPANPPPRAGWRPRWRRNRWKAPTTG